MIENENTAGVAEDVPAISAQPLDKPETVPVARATFWRRWLAYAIDAIILGFADGCLGFADGLISSLGSNEQAQGWWTVVWGIIRVAIQAIYFIWPYSTSGQTLGKRALKIK